MFAVAGAILLAYMILTVPATGTVLKRASIHAVALFDEIEFYGTGLKLMGMSDYIVDTYPAARGVITLR